MSRLLLAKRQRLRLGLVGSHRLVAQYEARARPCQDTRLWKG